MGAPATRPSDSGLAASHRDGGFSRAGLVLLVVWLLLLAAVGYLSYRSYHPVQRPLNPFAASAPVIPASQYAAAQQAAGEFALAVDGFDSTDPQGYLDAVSPLLTTKFAAEFTQSFEAATEFGESVAPAEQPDRKGEGKLIATAVAFIDEDSAEVLVAHDNIIHAEENSEQRHHRWAVELRLVNGAWLVDEFTAVS